MIAMLLLTMQQTILAPPVVLSDDTSAFRRLELPAPSATRSASGMPGPGYWQQRADYTIRAALDTVMHRLSGTATIRYTNNSPDTLRYLWLHVEQNLLRSDSRGAALNAAPNPPGIGFAGRVFASSGMTLFSIVAVRPARRSQLRIPLPSTVNGTLLRVELDRPLPRGETVTLETAFAYDAPEKATIRSAHGVVGEARIYQIGQWYPRVVVYDDVRGWNTDQYLGNGEFYFEYGDFDVYLTVPRSLVVAATGTLLNESDVLVPAQRSRLQLARSSDSVVAVIAKSEAGLTSSRPAGTGPTLTWHFRADNVGDFAWAAAPHFRWDAVGWNGVLVQAFYPASAPAEWTWQGWPPDSSWARSAERVRFAIAHYSSRWFPYPYPTATNVHGPTGSIEYPMLCFCGTGASVRDITGTTLHEMAHQWFPMIVGSNQREHAWMDEGLANFLAMSAWRALYPAESDHAASGEVDYWAQTATGSGLAKWWIAAVKAGRDEAPMVSPDRARSAWSQYSRPQAALFLLRHYVLDDTARFDAALREYVRRWAYKHPTPADFFRTMEDALGEDLAWFWRGAFLRAGTVELGVDSVTVRTDTAGRRLTSIHLANRGALPMPVMLRLTFADGSTQPVRLPVEIWYRGNRYIYAREFPVEVTRVEFDSQRVLPDVDRQNDVWPRSR